MSITVFLSALVAGIFCFVLLLGMSDFSVALSDLVFNIIFQPKCIRLPTLSERFHVALIGLLLGGVVGALLGWGGYALVSAFL